MNNFPNTGSIYNITTSLGNIIKSAEYIEDVSFDTKTVKLFKQPNGHKISVNPSYVVEVEEVQDNSCDNPLK
jgi:hypothetical protein